MSASRQKKLRQEQAISADSPKRRLTPEEKAAKKLKIWTIVFYVLVAVMVVGIIVSAVVNTGVLERNLIALTVGEHKITTAEMNYYFMDMVNSFRNMYGQMTSMLLDPNKTLNNIPYNDTQSFADYFLENAVNTAKDTYAVYDEAVAQGYTLTEDDQAAIDSNLSYMHIYAGMYGYSSDSAYIRAIFGRGCDLESYKQYLTIKQLATSYASQYREGLDYTQEEIDAHSEEDYNKYTSYSYRYYLIKPDAYYENTDATTHTDEETAAALKEAEAAAKEMAETTKGEEAQFQVAADKLSGKTDKDKTADSTLYKDTLRDKLVEELKEWVVAEDRQNGDTTYVAAKDNGGYYVAMFLDSNDNSKTPTVNVRHILISTSEEEGNEVTADQAKAKIEEIQAEFEKDPTEDNFATLAEKYTEDAGSKENGGLYEDITPGQMVETFNNWIFDGTRKSGDVGIVETDYGCHLIYFVGNGQYNYRDAMVVADLVNRDYNSWYESVTGAVTSTEGAAGLRRVHTNIKVGSNSSSQS